MVYDTDAEICTSKKCLIVYVFRRTNKYIYGSYNNSYHHIVVGVSRV